MGRGPRASARQEVYDALASPTAMEAFYNAHQSDFMTRYAGTDPLEDIAETIRVGINSPASEETNVAEMPAFGRDQMLSAEEIDEALQIEIGLGAVERLLGVKLGRDVPA